MCIRDRSDLLSNPKILNRIGRIIAKAFRDKKIDAVMTVATKGVPLANAVANVLNVPFVIVRRDLKITEGSTVSVMGLYPDECGQYYW